MEWNKISNGDLPLYYASILVMTNKGNQHVAWRAYDGESEKDIYTITGTDMIITEEVIKWRKL